MAKPKGPGRPRKCDVKSYGARMELLDYPDEQRVCADYFINPKRDTNSDFTTNGTYNIRQHEAKIANDEAMQTVFYNRALNNGDAELASYIENNYDGDKDVFGPLPTSDEIRKLKRKIDIESNINERKSKYAHKLLNANDERKKRFEEDEEHMKRYHQRIPKAPRIVVPPIPVEVGRVQILDGYAVPIGSDGQIIQDNERKNQNQNAHARNVEANDLYEEELKFDVHYADDEAYDEKVPIVAIEAPPLHNLNINQVAGGPLAGIIDRDDVRARKIYELKEREEKHPTNNDYLKRNSGDPEYLPIARIQRNPARYPPPISTSGKVEHKYGDQKNELRDQIQVQRMETAYELQVAGKVLPGNLIEELKINKPNIHQSTVIVPNTYELDEFKKQEALNKLSKPIEPINPRILPIGEPIVAPPIEEEPPMLLSEFQKKYPKGRNLKFESKNNRRDLEALATHLGYESIGDVEDAKVNELKHYIREELNKEEKEIANVKGRLKKSKKNEKKEDINVYNTSFSNEDQEKLLRSGLNNRRQYADIYDNDNEIEGFGRKRKSRKKVIIGAGIKKVRDNWQHFGKYLMNHTKLGQGYLSMCYPSTGLPIYGIKKTKITRDCAKILQGGNLLEAVHLDEPEKQLLMKIHNKAGINLSDSEHKILNCKNGDSNKDLLRRFDLITGEIDVGNNNPQLKDELSDIIDKMLNRNLLSRDEAKEILKNYIADI